MTLPILLLLGATSPKPVTEAITPLANEVVGGGIVLITGMILGLYYLWTTPRKDRKGGLRAKSTVDPSRRDRRLR
jgi:hypothetical protein